MVYCRGKTDNRMLFVGESMILMKSLLRIRGLTHFSQSHNQANQFGAFVNIEFNHTS